MLRQNVLCKYKVVNVDNRLSYYTMADLTGGGVDRRMTLSLEISILLISYYILVAY